MQITPDPITINARAEETMRNKHKAHMEKHQASFGAAFGEFRTPPTQEQLDKAFHKFQQDQQVKIGQRVTAQKKKQQQKKGGKS